MSMLRHLTFDTPARVWSDALPLGNGRLAAMVFGGPTDRWLLNHVTAWSGSPRSAGKSPFPARGGRRTSWSGANCLADVRRAVASGDIGRAEARLAESQAGHAQAFQPLAAVTVTIGDALGGARRELRLDEAVAGWTGDQGTEAEVFCSHPRDALIGTYSFERPTSVEIGITSPHQVFGHAVVESVPDGLLLVTRMPSDVLPIHDPGDEPIRFDPTPGAAVTAAVALVVATDGRVNVHETIAITGATVLTVVVTCDTDFVTMGESPHGDVGAVRTHALARASAVLDLPTAHLRAEHVTDYRSLYARFELDLGAAGGALDLRSALAEARSEPSPALVEAATQYGRYLMISASRPGTLPMNLQGLWNDLLRPPWSSNYTININTEMNYWPACPANLAECELPLFDLVDLLSRTGRRTARELYGTTGWVAHHNTDPWGFSDPVGNGHHDPCWSAWPFGGVWLLQHYANHADYTGEADLLDRAWSALDGATDFLLDFMVPMPDGTLGTCPSTSPENRYLLDGVPHAVTTSSTLDLALARATFSTWLHVARRRAEAGDAVPSARLIHVAEALSRLPLPQPTERGTYPEWATDLTEADPQHRHQSHLYDIYPGTAVTTYSPGQRPLIEAARRTLQIRGEHTTGWSLAWRLCLQARLKDPAAVMRLVRLFLTEAGSTDPWQGGVYGNLLCAHPPFQIDGNFGFTAGMCEVFAQSHGWIGGRRIYDLLPLELPWATGWVRGLVLRGGVTADLAWQDGRPARVRLRATRDVPARVLLASAAPADLELKSDSAATWTPATGWVVETGEERD